MDEGSGLRRISIRGSRFNEVVNGREVNTNMDSFRDIVIVNAAPVSRTYYKDAYDPNKVAFPLCWSADTQRPSTDVPKDQKQSNRCLDCANNIRGSGSNGGRACRFSQRLAVAFEGELGDIYQLQLPATSIYGKGHGGHMTMQGYVKFLSGRNAVATNILTRMYFDERSVVPKLYFKPVRSLGVVELDTVQKMINHPDTLKAITLDVSPVNNSVSPFDVVEGFEIDAN